MDREPPNREDEADEVPTLSIASVVGVFSKLMLIRELVVLDGSALMEYKGVRELDRREEIDVVDEGVSRFSIETDEHREAEAEVDRQAERLGLGESERSPEKESKTEVVTMWDCVNAKEREECEVLEREDDEDGVNKEVEENEGLIIEGVKIGEGVGDIVTREVFEGELVGEADMDIVEVSDGDDVADAE